jgi:hypothetical protein
MFSYIILELEWYPVSSDFPPTEFWEYLNIRQSVNIQSTEMQMYVSLTIKGIAFPAKKTDHDWNLQPM